jgi:dephospho-CoA kinase
MTLLEYITSLQDTGLSQEEIFAKAQEFKGRTKTKEVEVTETPVEEAKPKVVVEKDATAATTPGASESLSSGSGESVSQNDYSLKLSPTQGLSNKTGGFGTPEFYDEVFNNIALDEYEEKKEQYEKELSKYNKIKKSQEEGLDVLESGEVNFASRVIIPRGETGFDEYTIPQVEEAIKNKEQGFEGVVDLKDYVSKVPGAEIITYTENMDFEGAVGTLDEVNIQKYNPAEISEALENNVWSLTSKNVLTNDIEINKEKPSGIDERYFFTLESEKDAEKEKNDGSVAININKAQKYRTNELGNQASIEYPGITIDSVLESGKSFLTEKELEFTNLSLEEQNKIAEKENYGEALFFGDDLINIDLENVPEAQLELFEKSNELAATTEVGVLKDKLSQEYFNLVGLAKEIYNYDGSSSGYLNEPRLLSKNASSKYFVGFTDKQKEVIKEIATTGKLPKNLGFDDLKNGIVLPELFNFNEEDGHPLIKEFNNTFKNYKTISRAVLLNRDPLTTEQDSFWSAGAKRTGQILGIDVDTEFEKQKEYLTWIQSNGFKPSKSAIKNDLFVSLPNGSFNIDESFMSQAGVGAVDLTKWLGETYLFTRLTGNFVGNSQKALNLLWKNSTRLAKIPYAIPAFTGVTNVLASSANFTGGTLVSQYMDGEFDLEELRSSAGFGASIAVGHVAYDPFVAFLRKSKFGKFFSPVVDRLTKYAPNTYKRVSRSVGEGFTGATTYQLGGVINQGGIRDAEGNITISLKTQALELVKMVAAGVFTKGIPNFQTIKKEFKSDIINARNSGRLDLESRNSAAALGLNKDSVTDVNENSLDNLNNAFNKKVDDLLKRKRNGDITKEAADTEFKELKNNYRVIDTQIAVNSAYKMIKAEEASGNAPKQSEFYTVSGKIKSGEKLNERDGEVLSYYGLDGVGMLYKRLGIQKNSANDQYLQSLIMNESLIDAQLNGKSFILTPYGLQPINPIEFVTPKGSKARANTREFLRKRLELDIQISRLKSLDTKNLSESELLRHKDSIAKKQQELKEYVEGGKLYDNTQSEIQGAAITAYEKDLKQVDPSKGEVIEESTPDSFQKRYDESGFAKKDVKQTIAFTDKEGNKVINREFALEVRDFTPLTHEIPHSILKDSFKDAEGNVTAEGVEMIDGVLSKLTPVQTKTLKQELASRYNIDPESKELWYEENITVLAELMKRGEITFTKSLGEGLAGLVPAFKKLLPNIEVDAETGKGIFEMLKAQDLSRINITETETKDKSKVKVAKLSKTKAQDLAIKSKSKEGLTKKEEDELVEQVQLMAIEALGYKQGKGTVSRDKALGFVNDYIPGILRRFKPVKNVDGKDVPQQISTFVYRNIQPKQAKFYEQEIGSKSVETSISDERQKELEAIEDTSRGPVVEIDTDVKLVDNIKIEGKPLSVEFKDKVRGFVTEQLENVDINSEKFRKQVFKPSKAFVDLIVKDLIGNPKQFREFLNSNPTFYKGLSITDLVAIDDGRVKKGQPRLFTEPNRRLTKQADIEKFMMQGRIPYLTTTQQKAGAVLYNRLNPKVAAVINNFFGSTPQNNSNRKRAIAKAIANKFIAEATPSTEAFQAKPQLDKAKIAERLQVSQEAKFSEAKKAPKVMDTKNALIISEGYVPVERGKKGVDRTRKFVLGVGSDVFGVELMRALIATNKVLSTAGNRAYSYKPDGTPKPGGGAVGGGYNFVTNVQKLLNDYGPESKNPSPKTIQDTLALVKAGELGDLSVLQKELSETKKEGIYSAKDIAAIKRFIAHKNAKGGGIENNTKDIAEINRGKKLMLDGFRKIFEADNSAFPLIAEVSYSFNSNKNPFRDLATLVGEETGLKKGEKTWEEHMMQFGMYTNEMLKALKGSDKAWSSFVDWSNNNYYQLKLSKEASNLIDKNFKGAVDPLGNILVDWNAKSQFHPLQIESFKRAVKEGDYSKVIDPMIRAYNEYVSLNPFSITRLGVTDAKRYLDNVEISKANQNNLNIQAKAAELINKVIRSEAGFLTGSEAITRKQAKEILLESENLAKGQGEAAKLANEIMPKEIQYSKPITVQKGIDALAKTDKALANGRKLNAPVKKIRTFDFDFTLAKTKSNVLYTKPNVEGGFSEGSNKLKAIFMVGGPGAGKTNVGKGLELGRRGYKVVNQDIALEAMKAESGLPAKESDYTAEQRSTRSKLGAAARKAAVAKFDKYAANGDGMVVDGTGASYNATTKKIKALQEKGYEVHMVVANTPLETAIQRNKARTERSLPDFVVKKTYDQVQESLAKYKEDFGGRLYEINTEAIEYGKPLPADFLQIVYEGITANKVGKIDAARFAEEASILEKEGAEFDFREFSKVVDGEEGPLLGVAKKIAEKRGTDDVFVLTARPANAALPIKEFLSSVGLDIPLANITGLGDGTPQAKAGWIMGKAAEGYNDFYFADDHLGNVKAVKEVLSQIDVKSKVQQAKFSKAKTFDTVVNDMIEDSSGIEAYKKYSAARAKTVGASKGKYAFLIPPSAEDFTGLLYKMLGKGKKGDAQMAFLKTNLLDTYNRAESAVTQAKISAANDFVALKTKLKTLPKTLSKETGIGKFTYSHAVRVAAWTKQGMDIPGLSKRDVKELVDFVNKDAKLRVFTDELIKIQKGKEYPKPGKDWLGGNITTDIMDGINKVNRAEYQQEWRENIDIIFSEDNMNKMEAAYGSRWREAMEDSIRRMKSGSNRPIGGNRVTGELLDWLNNSVGAVMFLNTRSALLQTISAVNFINLSDNNIVKAGAAFANQKQFWGDFMTLMNSDYLVERRNGLKINVSESEIADAVREAQNKPKAAIAFLLSKGFVMTRFADSFAIASGGSTFYRNRLKSLLKSGMDQKAAEAQAFADFKAVAETSQQSSSPSKISQQQASGAGRVILAWANTPMQYARIQKRAAQDLINGRGDWRTHVSNIVYYGAIQNLIFNTLQSAAFALGFGDDDETDEAKAKKKEDKAYEVANGMIDSQLRGLGIFGTASVAVKNTLMTLYKEHNKKGSKYENAVEDLLSFSPPLGSKIGKITGGLRSASWNKKDMKEKGFSLDNPAYMAGAQVVTGLTNVPFDRVMKKINNLRGLVNERSALWQKVALGLGWGTWELGLGYYGGFDKEKPLTPKQQLKLEVDTMKKDTSKSDQVKTLLDFGLTKKQIRELENENNRVKKILELQKKDKK